VKSTEDFVGEQTVPSGASERWSRYRSPLQSYPFSRWHLQLTDPSGFSNESTASSSDGSSILTPSGSFSSNSASGSASVDSKDATVPGDLLRSLKMTTLFKNVDLDRRICQFEIPGGGVCRDDECEDLHIEKELETWEPSGASRIPQDGVLLTLSMLTFGLACSVPSPFPWVDYPIFSPFFNAPLAWLPSPQMTTQPSTYPRRLRRRQVGIDGREGAQRTLGTFWRKPEQRRKRRNWDLKTVSSRHCRSSGSHKTLSVSLGHPSGRPFVPSLSEGCGTVCVVGREYRMSKERERAPDVSLTLANLETRLAF